ncbi:MAG TPA: DUF4097 family beta strand repeat-containing protein [Candidatus Polarisedimenticolaceae bacterium]|nr:DUF4097 family beta strand repeat-containing protein [Candidatus Polarisedimenticolaceae bacterium]
MTIIRSFVGSLVALSCYGLVAAQVTIDRSLPAPKQPEVVVENMFGTIEIRAWSKNEVRVSGRLAPGAEGLAFDADQGEFHISVEAPEHWLYESDDDTDYRSQLVVELPTGSSVGVRSLNASIRIDGVNGLIEVESVNGAVSIGGDPRVVRIESMTGTVDVQAVAAAMQVESVSGDVTLVGATRAVEVETISGGVILTGSSFEEVSIETVSGSVSIEGSLTAQGGIEVETHNGTVEIVVPAATRARFSFSTFNGSIENTIGPSPRKTGRFEPYTELRFSTGSEDFEVSVETFSGNISLRTN